MAARVVQILITGNSDQAIAELEKMVTSTERASLSMGSKFADVGKFAVLGIAAAAATVVAFGVKQAMEQEAASSRLKVAIENTGASYSKYRDEIEKTAKAGINLGFDNANVESSLARLVSASHDTGKAIGAMGLAEDIARGRHVDLTTATDLLAKVMTGHVALLGRLGIATKDASGNTISQGEAIKKLTEMYGGTASAYTQTFAGKIEVLKAQMSELAEKVGFVVIPIIESLASAVSSTIGWFMQHKEAAIALAVVIGGVLVAAVVAWIASMEFAKTIAAWNVMVSVAEAVATAIYGMTAAGLAFAAAATLGIAAVVIFGSRIGDSFSAGVDRASAAAQRWSQNTITAGDTVAALTPKLAEIEKQFKAEAAAGDVSAAALVAYATKHTALTTEVAKLTAEHKAALIVTKAAAQVYGIELPAGVQLSTAELKAMKTAIGLASDEFGTVRTQALVSLGDTSAYMIAAVKSADALQKAVVGSMDKSTDAFSHFGSAASVSESQMETFFTGSITRSADWATEIKTLIGRGVDSGIVAEMAKAGPDSKPSLDAFAQMVDQNGVEWVNNWASKGAEAKQVMIDQMAEMQFEVEKRLAQLRWDAQNSPLMLGVNADQANAVIEGVRQNLAQLTSHGYGIDITGSGGGLLQVRP